MAKRKKHDWQSLNREVHAPEDMMLNDLFEEIRCAVTDSDVQALVFMLDDGNYTAFGNRVASLLRWMGDKPNNKTAPKKR